MKLDSTIAAVVTGGASGLGAATARALGALGVKVAIFDLPFQAGAATVVAEETGGLYCVADVTSDESVDAALAKARAAHGQERILVNCAGVVSAGTTLRSGSQERHLPLEVFNRVIQVNLVGTFRCVAKSAAGMADLPALDAGERGVIVNTGSIAAEEGQTGQAAYAASKGGVAGLTLPVARDLASRGIRVNTILPGVFNTPLVQAAPQSLLRTVADSATFPRRLGDPSEFASLALEIIRNTYLNGAKLRLDAAVCLPLIQRESA